MTNQLIQLDLNGSENRNQIIKGRVKDGQIKKIDVLITDNGQPTDLTTFKLGQLRGTNSNGEFVACDVPITSKVGAATVTLPKTMFTRSGKFQRAYFVFTDAKDGQISTADFNIFVLPDSDIDDGAANTLIDQYNAYVKKLKDAFDKQVALMNSDVAGLGQSIKDKEAAFNKTVGELQAKLTELKTTIDKMDFQKYKITLDNGGFGLSISSGNDGDAAMLAVGTGFKTFYQEGGHPSNATGNTLKGTLNIVGGSGNAIAVNNSDQMYFKRFIGNKAGVWHRVSTTDDLNPEYGQLTTINKPDFNSIIDSGNYQISEPNLGLNGPSDATFNGRLEVRTVWGAKSQTFNTDSDNKIWSRHYISFSKEWTPWIRVATNVDVDSKENKIADTGWVKVALINGWHGDINVRLRDGVIYHKGNFSAAGSTGAISSAVFKYPDSFGDLSGFNQFNGGWAAITSDGQTDYGFLKGEAREFFCWMKGTEGEASVSNIVFRL